MGVRHLWTILTPFCDRKPLFELQGKTLAVDLSCWIVDSQSVTDNIVQPKMYLRNLYFRTANLLLQDIYPVFVLEGKAPELKQKTIQRRNELQQIKKTGTVAVRKATAKQGRTRFNNILKECQEMLSCMGLECVQGNGEAEAMCAYLNADGMVDGCVSQDNDCFLYGAKVVYRNFNLSGATASGGSIDVYNMEKTENALKLDRKKMIALALLCGCDYNDGLNGVGKEAVLKLFEHVRDEDILDRLKSWKTDGKFDRMEEQLANSKLCTSCGHEGNIRVHSRVGCPVCRTAKSCSTNYKEERKLIMNEINLRKKAIIDEDFPNEEIIDEYLTRKGPVPSSLDLKWQQPKLVKFMFFMEKKLGWESDYTFEKFLPLITRWQLVNLPEISLRHQISFSKYATDLPVKTLIFPDRIKKIRNIKSVASYEVIWTDSEGCLEGLVTLKEGKSSEEDEASEKVNVEAQNSPGGLLATIEPQNLMLNCYPDVVERFEEEKAAKKKPRKVKTRDKNADKLKKPATKRERKKLVDVVNTRKIEDYLTKNDKVASLEDSFNSLEITPKRLKCAPQIERIKAAEEKSEMNNTLDRMFDNLTPDDFESECEESFDMSLIIDEICSIKTRSSISPGDNKTAKSNSRKIKPVQRLTTHKTAAQSNPSLTDAQICATKCKSSSQKTLTKPVNQVLRILPDEDISIDEFADIENYVPLNERVNPVKQIS